VFAYTRVLAKVSPVWESDQDRREPLVEPILFTESRRTAVKTSTAVLVPITEIIPAPAAAATSATAAAAATSWTAAHTDIAPAVKNWSTV
jgi:hypothetical protein